MKELVNLRQSSRAALCVSCGKCTTMCPLAEHGDFSARKVIHEGHEGLDADSVRDLGLCLTCASCEQRCPQGVDFTEYVRGARAMLPEGSLPPRPHAGIFDRTAALGSNGNGRPALRKIFDGLETSEEGETALFVGCLPHFDMVFSRRLGFKTVEIARAAVRLLNRLDIAPVIVSEELCCGHDQLWTGQRDRFEELARHNLRSFERRGVKTVLSACAECARTWKLDYERLEDPYRPEILHLTEFLDARGEELSPQFRKARRRAVSYQDPCRLGRHMGRYDAPRDLLARIPGVELREMEKSGRDAVCCGTPGFIHCDATSKALQRERLGEARDTEAAVLLTACPKCLIHFSCSLEEDRRNGNALEGLEVQDITLFTAARLKRVKSNRSEKSPTPREAENG